MTAQMKVIGLALTVGLGMALASGCTSVHSTQLEKLDGYTWSKKKTKGIPTTLRVPSQIRLTVKGLDAFNPDPNGPTVTTLVTQLGRPVVTSVDHDIIYDDKIFMVDPKRPAAGTLKVGVALGPDRGNITSYNSEIDDQTIQELNTTLSTILGAIPGLGGGGAPETAADDLNADFAQDPGKPIMIDAILATAVFDVNDPMLEHNMMQFLNSVLHGFLPIAPTATVVTGPMEYIPGDAAPVPPPFIPEAESGPIGGTVGPFIH